MLNVCIGTYDTIGEWVDISDFSNEQELTEYLEGKFGAGVELEIQDVEDYSDYVDSSTPFSFLFELNSFLESGGLEDWGLEYLHENYERINVGDVVPIYELEGGELDAESFSDIIENVVYGGKCEYGELRTDAFFNGSADYVVYSPQTGAWFSLDEEDKEYLEDFDEMLANGEIERMSDLCDSYNGADIAYIADRVIYGGRYEYGEMRHDEKFDSGAEYVIISQQSGNWYSLNKEDVEEYLENELDLTDVMNWCKENGYI